MRARRNDYDVTDTVQTTDYTAVAGAVEKLYLDLYEKGRVGAFTRPFGDFNSMFCGQHPEYRACDTSYHDLQHTLDVTLAMGRLMHGYERVSSGRLGERLFRLGILVALYHDFGYLRHRKDTRHRNGAEYTKTHVSRGARFLRLYLPTIGLGNLARVAANIVHFTGFEVPTAEIPVPQPVYRVMGNMVGSADILAQMADRCYLEKCRERLYDEFVVGGIARQMQPDGQEKVVFASAEDLISKTPGFYHNAIRRLDNELEGVHRYLEAHFNGRNLYLEAMENNINYARDMKGDMGRLRRRPPNTLVDGSQLDLIPSAEITAK